MRYSQQAIGSEEVQAVVPAPEDRTANPLPVVEFVQFWQLS